jgi:hypothetical protein
LKYQRTEQFKRDYRRLSDGEKEQFRQSIRTYFAPAADEVAGGGDPWPKRLRVKGVQGAKGVWEMTWSFTDPDGRATFEWIQIDGEPAIRWRRVGSQAIFAGP